MHSEKHSVAPAPLPALPLPWSRARMPSLLLTSAKERSTASGRINESFPALASTVPSWMTAMFRFSRLGLLVLLAATTVGCANRATPGDSADRTKETPGPDPGIYRLEDGERVDRSQLFERLADATWVVVGERHTTSWHHDRQAAIYDHLVEVAATEVALGMEMFQSRHQSVLDSYVRGDISESEMLEGVEWNRTWGMDRTLYQDLWRRTAETGNPLVGLNLERSIVRDVSRKGLDGLPDSTRKKLPDTIDTSDERQREFLRRVFGGHDAGKSDMNFEHFVEAQATWDEFMAREAYRYVSDHDEVGAMVVVCGRGHARRFGVPSRIARRASEGADGDEVVSILPFDRRAQSPMGSLSVEKLQERDVADFVWIGPEGS